MTDRPSIFIALLCGPERTGWIHPKLARALVYFTTDERADFELYPIWHSKTSQEARNHACDVFLETKHTHLLFIDNDTVPESFDDRIINLLDLAFIDADIVGAPCPVKQNQSLHLNIYEHVGEEMYRPILGADLMAFRGPCDAVGTGVMMIRRRVIEAMHRVKWTAPRWLSDKWEVPLSCPAFLRPRYPDGRTIIGEDLLFCQHAKGLGFSIYASMAHACDHVHSIQLNEIPEMLPGLGPSPVAKAVPGLCLDASESDFSLPTFSICHASARPQAWQETWKAWILAADQPDKIEYVLAVDSRWGFSPQTPIFREHDKLVWIPPIERKCAVVGWNAAAKASTGHVLILNSDDMRPPAHWDTELLARIPQMNAEFVLEVSAGKYADSRRLMVLQILSRTRYQKLGYALYPEYDGLRSDVDFTLHAQHDGVVIDARAVKFVHDHPIERGESIEAINADPVYAWENRQEGYEIGRTILERRIKEGFTR